MSIKIKLAQLSLLVALFVGAVAALPVGDNKVLDYSGTGIVAMGECNGSSGTCT